MVHQPNNNNNGGTNNSTNNRNISIVVPYIQGLGERFKRTCNKGIHKHLKATNTTKTLLMAPKDRDNKLQKSGIIYKFKCPHINCPKEYIGESGRTFGTGTKNTLGPYPPSTSIATPQDTQSALNFLPLPTRSHKESQETSRGLCTSM